MPRLSTHTAAVSLFLLTAAFFATASQGDELPTVDQPVPELPTIDELIEVTPNLDTSDPETESFRFTVQVAMPPMKFQTTMAWQRDKLIGMRMLMGKHRYPGWFISNNEAQLFDACHGRLYKLPPTHPGFFLRSSDGKLTSRWSTEERSADEEPEPIVLDLKSIIRETRDRSVISTNGREWIQVTAYPSKCDQSGEVKGGGTALYYRNGKKNGPPYIFYRLVIFADDHVTPVITVDHLSFNETGDIQWPAAPADESFPEDVSIVDLRLEENNTLFQMASAYVAHSSVLWVQAALEDEEGRDHEIFLGVDWDKTQRFATEVGPEVKRLWR